MEPEAAGGQWGRGCGGGGGGGGASAGQDQPRQHLPRRRGQAAAGRSAGTGHSAGSFGRLREGGPCCLAGWGRAGARTAGPAPRRPLPGRPLPGRTPERRSRSRLKPPRC